MRSDVLTNREAVILLESVFIKHGITVSASDLLNDLQRPTALERRGYPQIPIAKHRGRRLYRRADVEKVARWAADTLKGKAPRKHPKLESLTFFYHVTEAEKEAHFETLH